jgi:RNA polymerase sigma-70 factor (ECF subfamily)
VIATALTDAGAPRYRPAMATTMVGATDGDLARAIANGAAGTATEAEAELYRRFAPRVRLYGRRHLRQDDEACDLMQQVLLLTIEKLREGAVRDVDTIGSFILGASRMLAVNVKRRARRRAELLDSRPVEHPVSPESAAINDDALEGCLLTLSERERTIVVQTFYAERSSREIAQVLGISEGNVRVLRSRAITRLRACLGAGERAS